MRKVRFVDLCDTTARSTLVPYEWVGIVWGCRVLKCMSFWFHTVNTCNLHSFAMSKLKDHTLYENGLTKRFGKWFVGESTLQKLWKKHPSKSKKLIVLQWTKALKLKRNSYMIMYITFILKNKPTFVQTDPCSTSN